MLNKFISKKNFEQNELLKVRVGVTLQLVEI